MYDESRDYLKYPTFGPLRREMTLPVEFIPCPSCGSTYFGFRMTDRVLVCRSCGWVPPQMIEKPLLTKELFGKRLGCTHHLAAVRPDGSAITRIDRKWNYGQHDVTHWTGLTAIATGHEHTAGLRNNGTVITAGSNFFGQCNTEDWSGITSISTGYFHTAGLRFDGTVRAVGGHDWPQVRTWTDILAIASGPDSIIGLRHDGTVKSTDHDTSDWTEITAIAAGGPWHWGTKRYGRNESPGDIVMGLCADGTVRVCCSPENALSAVSKWSNITAISVGHYHVAGLCADGSVVTESITAQKKDPANVSSWRNIIAIAAGPTFTAGLRSDGTIVCTDPELEIWLNENLG